MVCGSIGWTANLLCQHALVAVRAIVAYSLPSLCIDTLALTFWLWIVGFV